MNKASRLVPENTRLEARGHRPPLWGTGLAILGHQPWPHHIISPGLSSTSWARPSWSKIWRGQFSSTSWAAIYFIFQWWQCLTCLMLRIAEITWVLRWSRWLINHAPRVYLFSVHQSYSNIHEHINTKKLKHKDKYKMQGSTDTFLLFWHNKDLNREVVHLKQLLRHPKHHRSRQDNEIVGWKITTLGHYAHLLIP